MKNLLPFLVFCLSFTVLSQEIRRKNIDGKIIVEGSSIEGITIYNTSSKTGVLTNKNGEFTIALALNDFIEIRALQYQQVGVKVNTDILKSKELHIFLIEEINKLDEVIVKTKGLTGNLKTDLKNIQTFNPKMDALYFGIHNKGLNEPRNNSKSLLENIATRSQDQIVNGLDIINVVDQLLIPLFRSEVKNKKAVGIPEVPVNSIKYYLGSTFLVENFDIPEHRVEEFIRYVEDDAFEFDLLNYGHEIEFLELLNRKSKTFLNPKTDTDS
jgi:hypothetical protein